LARQKYALKNYGYKKARILIELVIVFFE